MFAEVYRESDTKNTAQEDGVKYSINKYSEHQRENWNNSKRIVVYNNQEQLLLFIRDSIADNTSNKKMYFGSISSDLSERILEDTGLNVENYNLSLGAFEIRKILKDHGNENTEAPRGQRAVVPDDFAHIVDIITNPQRVALSENTYMGKPVIIFTGEHNGRMNVVAVVSDKRLDLFVQTAYVNTKKGNLPTPTGEQAPINTPEANSGTVSNINLPQNGHDVNTSISENTESDTVGEQKYSVSKDGQAAENTGWSVSGEDVRWVFPLPEDMQRLGVAEEQETAQTREQAEKNAGKENVQ